MDWKELFTVNHIIGMYLVVINVIAWITYGIDKRKARKHKWRIPEAKLILLAVIGGSVGALLGMGMFRHKTRKPAFKVGIPVILVLQIVLIVWLHMKIV